MRGVMQLAVTCISMGVLLGGAFLMMALPELAFAKCIGKDQVNIRSGPNLKSEVIFRAPLAYPIEIKKEEGEWVFFRDWENNTGWVYKPLISDARTAIVVAKNANIRSLPGKEHKIAAKAGRGEIYKVLGVKNNWVELGYYYGNDSLGWIRSDLVFGE